MAKPEPLITLGFSAISWIEHYLVHGPGDVQGQPIELDDEFAAFIVKAYRVRPRTGEKVVRRSFLSRPKGRAKSELAGMLDCFEAIGPCRFDHWAEPGEVSDWGYAYEVGEPVGKPLAYVEILNVATEEGQAGNTYDNAYYMLHADTCSPELLADFGRLDVGLTRINLPNRRGFIEPVTAANESKDGGKSTFIVADETHLWIPPAVGKFRLGKMHQTMARNLLKRKVASGWMLETSTMYAEGEGSVAQGTHAYAKSPAGRGGKLLFDHRQASDGYDLTKRSDRMKALREVYGPAAAWMPLGEIADSYDDPQVDPGEWERFWLNRPVPLKGAPPSIFPWWPSRIGEPTMPTALGVAADRHCKWFTLGGASPGFVDLITPAAFADAGPRVPASSRAKFVAEVARIAQDYGIAVGLQEKGPAWVLKDDLEEAGAPVEPVPMDDFVQSCADFRDDGAAGALCHGGQVELDEAVRAAQWRAYGERQVISRKTSDIPELEAVLIARHVATHATDPWEAWT